MEWPRQPVLGSVLAGMFGEPSPRDPSNRARACCAARVGSGRDGSVRHADLATVGRVPAPRRALRRTHQALLAPGAAPLTLHIKHYRIRTLCI